MDEFFGGPGKLRMISITDSTMMSIAHAAMNRAHERVKSKEGVIERLSEMSKFYELAVMQLEGCMEFVQDESSHEEEVLAGLLETRDRLKGRLSESENAIGEKDRELVERAESEMRLRQALEMKERELASLKEKLKRVMSRNEGVGGRDGEFSELKNSVDQQVWNIRQKLEPDYKNKFRGDDKGGIGNEKLEQMGLDIDALKETLDVAFRKMRSAILLSEVAPIEQQWKWGVEKDTLCVLIRGLVFNFQKMFEGKVRRSHERKFPVGFDELWHGFLDEAEGLKSELSSLFCRQDELVLGKSSGSLQAKPSLEVVNVDESENYVAKMIKNHESIIRKKSAEAEELSWLRREIAREKSLSSIRGEKEPVSLKKRVQEVTLKLDNLMQWKDKVRESFGDHGDNANGEEIIFDTLAEAWESMNKVSDTVDEEPTNKIPRLEQELEDSNWASRIMEETYCDLLEGFLKELNYESCRNTEINNVDSEIREELYFLVFKEIINDFGSYNVKVAESDSVRVAEFSKKLDNMETEAAISEDIQRLVFGEIFKDWNKSVEVYNTDFLVMEEICRVVFDETVKSVVDAASFALRRCEEIKLAELDECNKASLIKEEIFEFVSLQAVKDEVFHFSSVVDSQNKRLGCLFCDMSQTYKQESLIQKVDHILKCQEVEEQLMLSLCSKIKGIGVELNPAGLGCETFGNTNPNSFVKSKLQKAVQKIAMSKEKLAKMASSLGIVIPEPLMINDRETAMCFVQDRKSSVNKSKVNGLKQLVESDSVLAPIIGFFQKVVDFEQRVDEKLELNCLRLEEIKHRLSPLVKIVSSIREKETVYRKAFTRRCQNLHRAEIEVDLLGDQVEALLGLLQKIHTSLQYGSPTLLPNVRVSELLQMIKKELNRVIHTPKHRYRNLTMT